MAALQRKLGLLTLTVASLMSAQIIREAATDLIIDTQAEARIYLDGRPAGTVGRTGRLTIKETKPGTHTVEVRARDKRPFKTQITVVEGKTAQVTAKLEDLTGNLEIMTVPQAEVQVDGKRAGVADSSGRALVWNIPACERCIGEHDVRVSRAGYNPEERKVRVAPDAVTTVTITLTQTEASAEPGGPAPKYAFHRRMEAIDFPASIRFSSDGRRVLAVADYVACPDPICKGKAMLWETDTGRLLWQKDPVLWANGRSSISADLRSLIVPVRARNEVRIYEAETGNLTRQLSHRNVAAAHLSPDGKYLYTLGACTTNNKGDCTDTTTAVLWDFAAGKQLRTWGNGTGVAAISPDGIWIGEEMDNDSPDASTIVLWNLPTGESVRRFEIDGVYPKLYFSPDSRWIVINTKSAQVFEVSTGKRGPTLDLGNGDATSSVAFTADSRFMAGAVGDIVMWSLSTGQEVTRLKVPGSDARTLAISPDGRWIAGSSSGYLTLFRRAE